MNLYSSAAFLQVETRRNLLEMKLSSVAKQVYRRCHVKWELIKMLITGQS